MTNWNDALSVRDLEQLGLILLLVREHYELTGQWPTAVQLQALLLKPS